MAAKHEHPVPSGVRQAIGELVTCSRCIGKCAAAGLCPAVTRPECVLPSKRDFSFAELLTKDRHDEGKRATRKPSSTSALVEYLSQASDQHRARNESLAHSPEQHLDRITNRSPAQATNAESGQADHD